MLELKSLRDLGSLPLTSEAKKLIGERCVQGYPVRKGQREKLVHSLSFRSL